MQGGEVAVALPVLFARRVGRGVAQRAWDAFLVAGRLCGCWAFTRSAPRHDDVDRLSRAIRSLSRSSGYNAYFVTLNQTCSVS